jgi:transposase
MKEQDGHIILTKDEYNKLLSDYLILKEELSGLKRLIFGKKNERFIPQSAENNQLSLFENEVQSAEKQEIHKEEISYQRTKKDKNKPKRQMFPANLERVVEIIEPENLPEGAVKFSEETTEVLAYKPNKIFVRVIIRYKYIIKSQDQNKENQIFIAEMPSDLPLPRSNASASLLAYFLVSKFVDHLPFYRVIQIFKRQQINLSEATVNNWFSSVCRLLEPLYDELKKQVRQSHYNQADESPMPVQTQDKPGATHKGYQWVYHSPPDKLVCFDYQKRRDRIGPTEFLDKFSGYLQTDGYAAYNEFGNHPDITLLSCWAHVRRKFEQSLKTYPAVADYVMREIQKLYAIEHKIKEEKLSENGILELRQKESRPIIEKLQEYLFEQKDKVIPKSDIGKAVNYALSLMPRLKVYLTDGRLLIDNNLVENTIRPLALGRKNYLFAGSHESAQRIAMMYSFFGSCKLNNVEPYEWLKNVLEKILNYNIQNLKELLPNFKC